MPFVTIPSKLVQICFAKDANLENVKSQLEELSKREELTFICCFLPRHIVEEKGWNTDICDLLENTLGEKLEWALSGYETFDEAMANIEKEREIVAIKTAQLYVLDSGTAEGVRKEIDFFTRHKVILMP